MKTEPKILDPMHLDDTRRAIVSAPGDLLVTGGPGSGKTTVALLKAQARIQTLEPGQTILFLSFSRAAVRQLLLRCGDILLPSERKHIDIKTYHRFCLDVLRSHGQLLHGKPIRFLSPRDEALRKARFNGNWKKERLRLAHDEAWYCFDLVASAVAQLFEKCRAMRSLYTDKYPLVIVDEFQDTDDDQWRIIQYFLDETDVCCLADPDQRIFEYNGVDPRRIQMLRNSRCPREFDLHSNFRSPTASILDFADAVLPNRSPLPPSPQVTLVDYCHENQFDATVHATVMDMLDQLRGKGIEPPSMAVLGRSNRMVQKLSALLSGEHRRDGQKLPPVKHDVLWDATLLTAVGQVIGSLLEWPAKSQPEAVWDTVQLVAQYHWIASISKTQVPEERERDRTLAQEYDKAFRDNTLPQRQTVQALQKFAREGLAFVGNPHPDWDTARNVLKDVKDLERLYAASRMLTAMDALGIGLSDLWLASGNYRGASHRVERIVNSDTVGDRAPQGCVLMTMHKAKGKEFDGVVLVEDRHVGKWFGLNSPDRKKSDEERRLLRMAITRARRQVQIVRPFGATPL